MIPIHEPTNYSSLLPQYRPTQKCLLAVYQWLRSQVYSKEISWPIKLCLSFCSNFIIIAFINKFLTLHIDMLIHKLFMITTKLYNQRQRRYAWKFYTHSVAAATAATTVCCGSGSIGVHWNKASPTLHMDFI